MINNNDILNIFRYFPIFEELENLNAIMSKTYVHIYLSFFSPFIFAYFLWKHDRFTSRMSVTLWLSAIIGLRLSDFLKILFFSSLRNAKCIAKKAPAGICELTDGLIHRMRINFGEASRAKLNDAEGKKIERWLSEGSIFQAKATVFDPSGRLVPRTLRTQTRPHT